MKIFDTHAHYDSRAFSGDRDAILSYIHTGFDVKGETVSGEKTANNETVLVGRIVNNGADMASSYTSLRLTEEYDYIYAAVGVHPDSAGELIFCPEGCAVYGDEDDASVSAAAEAARDDATVSAAVEAARDDATVRTVTDADNTSKRKIISENTCRKNREELRVLASKEKVVAIGEIGLDYHWDVWPREIQRKAFEWQWGLAEEMGLPVIIHSRDAAEDTLRIVKGFYEKLTSVKAVMHCYSYSVEHASEYLKLGLMFGIGGVLTFKNARKLNEVVDMLPMDHILLETDCPYMAPDPFRGKRNNSGYLTYVAEKIAQIKGLDVKQVYDTTWDNACRFFNQ